MREKVLLGMSGGVDSSTAAILLKESGYDVIGATMLLYGDNYSEIEDSKKVAEILGIPHHTIDLRDEFKTEVVDYFLEEYKNGRTPNPCVKCNKAIKFGKFLEFANSLGAKYIATGHYALKLFDEKDNTYSLKQADNVQKDQTYVLYNLTQEILERTLFPIGKYTKDEIREIAKKNNLPVFSKKDSQDICFIPDGDYISFLNLPVVSGNFIDVDGNILGTHTGISNYTIGQRKGLGITFGKPMFVVGISAKDNTITLGEEGSQYRTSLIASNFNFTSGNRIDVPIKCSAKIRYSAKPSPVTAYTKDDLLYVEFEKPERSITPGQSVVLYNNDILLGGGVII